MPAGRLHCGRGTCLWKSETDLGEKKNGGKKEVVKKKKEKRDAFLKGCPMIIDQWIFFSYFKTLMRDTCTYVYTIKKKIEKN